MVQSEAQHTCRQHTCRQHQRRETHKQNNKAGTIWETGNNREIKLRNAWLQLMIFVQMRYKTQNRLGEQWQDKAETGLSLGGM